MASPLHIGNKIFKFKKDAILHYRRILNSYKFGELLNEEDFKDVLHLMEYNYLNKLRKITPQTDEEYIAIKKQIETGVPDFRAVDFIECIQIAKVQFNTKCFEVIRKEGQRYHISYLQLIRDSSVSLDDLFYKARRNLIHDDVRAVKQRYFDEHSVKGRVKCQETGKLSRWEDVVVDHRQPNTFSVIVERFKEIHNIDVKQIFYKESATNIFIFDDPDLNDSFRDYHKKLARLRIVRKECNASRTGMARVKTSSKDLRVD